MGRDGIVEYIDLAYKIHVDRVTFARPVLCIFHEKTVVDSQSTRRRLCLKSEA